MKEINFNIPKEVEVGYEKSKQLSNYASNMGIDRLLIVADKILAELGILDKILVEFEETEIEYTIYNKIQREPTVNDIDSAIDELQIDQNFDGVVGIGGGSVMDTAKILAASAEIKGSIKSYIGTGTIEKPGLPMIMIPSTSGTGSEATPNAIVKDEEAQSKKGIVSPYLIPDLVILDPALTLSLPPKVTAETGMDAFTHAIECFISKKANYLSDIYALKSIELISKYIRKAASEGENKEARYYMILASFMGGVAITNSGTGGVHALSYPLGGKYGISHGLSNSVLLPDVMEFNAEAVPEKFVKVATAMNIPTEGRKTNEILDSVVKEIQNLIEDLDIKLDDFELSNEVVNDLAKNAMQVDRLLNNNPREIKYEDAVNIYKSALK